MIEYFLDEATQHRFRVKGANGEIVATSEPYSSLDHAHRGVRDLYLILLKALGGTSEEVATDLGIDGGSGSSTAAQPSDAKDAREDEEPSSLSKDDSNSDDLRDEGDLHAS